MTLIEQQRAARLARDAAIPPRIENRPDFWDNINSSDGPDACHLWTGQRKFNHSAKLNRGENPTGYYHGWFEHAQCVSRIATRVLIFLCYGTELPRDIDLTPICGEHLCMNIRHLATCSHGGRGAKRLNDAVPVEDYFRDRDARAA